MLDNFKTGVLKLVFLFSLYKIYCTDVQQKILHHNISLGRCQKKDSKEGGRDGKEKMRTSRR